MITTDSTLQLIIPILVVLILWLFGRHGKVAILHPGVWFAAAWILCIACYTLTDIAGAVPVHDDLQLEKLETYLVLTAVIFFGFSLLGTPVSKTSEAKSRAPMLVGVWERSTSLMVILACIGLAASFANVVLLGIGFVYTDATRQQWLSGIPLVTARLWYPYLPIYPVSFVTGFQLSRSVLTGEKLSKAVIVSAMMAFAAGFLWMVGTGGRQALGFQVLYFLVGGAFGWGRIEAQPQKRLLRKVAAIGGGLFAVCAVLALIVNFTGTVRAHDQGLRGSKLSDLEYVGWGGQFFEYMGGTISTFQAYGEPARRNLSDTGPVTIAAIHDLGAGWLFGWRRPEHLDTNPERALAGTDFAMASGTRCVFYDLEADFGFYGAVAALLILVALSQFLFMATVRRTGNSLLGYGALSCFLMFWGYSHQFSLFMSNFPKWLFVSFAFWDYVHYVVLPRTSPRGQRQLCLHKKCS